jgi:hypothetical protein
MDTRLLLRLIFLVIFLPSLAAPAWAAEVAGVKIDDKTRVADTELSLTGAGLRKKLFFQVYAIGLYVREPKADPISQPGPKRVLIHMLRDAGADAFIDALVDGIKQNHSEADARVLEPRVQALAATITDIKEVKKGTRIALDWNGTATQLLIDGKAMGKPVEGEDFYRALLRTWLGDKPIQEDLKKALLGAG